MKAPGPIDRTPLSRYMLSMLLHDSNAPFPIIVTLLGITNFKILEHPLKALSPIEMRFSPKYKLSILVHHIKAYFPIVLM